MREEVRHSEGGGGLGCGETERLHYEYSQEVVRPKNKKIKNKTRELYNEDSLVIFKSKT